MCHLCGHIEATPDRCNHCGSTELVHAGVGTERVELALQRDLAGIRVLRLDRDASRGKALLDTLAQFRNHEADVNEGKITASRRVEALVRGLRWPEEQAAEPRLSEVSRKARAPAQSAQTALGLSSDQPRTS
jgi:hypothetical protein